MLVREELDGGVGEDTQEGGGMTAEETTDAGLPVDVSHGGDDAEPGASVFGKLGVRGLEEDFDAVEGTDDCFGLVHGRVSVDRVQFGRRIIGAYGTSCQPACETSSKDIVQVLLVVGLAPARIQCYRRVQALI